MLDVKMSFDKAKAIAELKAANDYALTMTANQAMKDISQYVPKDQTTLESSGISSSDRKAVDGSYTFRWSTPYAQYLWHGDVMFGNPRHRTYGPAKITFTEAMAREEWAKYAQQVHGDIWQKVYEAALKKQLGG